MKKRNNPELRKKRPRKGLEGRSKKNKLFTAETVAGEFHREKGGKIVRAHKPLLQNGA